MFRRSVVRAARGLVGVSVAASLLVVPGAPAASAAPSTGFVFDLARAGDFVAQKNGVQCVGASIQMMLNIVGPTDDVTAARQSQVQVLARGLSGPSRMGRIRRGASVRGWMAALNTLGVGPYRLLGAVTIDAAMEIAARAIRTTGRPVGLLTWKGGHAWVMSGFRATADPLVDGSATVTAAIVMDPLYPRYSNEWGPGPRPREALTIAELARQFVPRQMGSGLVPPASSWGAGLPGRYVLVLPIDPTPLARQLLRAS